MEEDYQIPRDRREEILNYFNSQLNDWTKTREFIDRRRERMMARVNLRIQQGIATKGIYNNN